jgi:hypothetical protein
MGGGKGGRSDLGLTIDVLGKDADVTSALFCTVEINSVEKESERLSSPYFLTSLKKQKLCLPKPQSGNFLFHHYRILTPITLRST